MNGLIESTDKLVQFELNKGVSPFDLIMNITEDDYYEVSVKKQKNGYICDVKFTEHNEFEDVKKLNFRYYYDKEMTLIQISMVDNGYIYTLWTRECEQRKLLSNILDLINDNVNKKLFIEKLPKHLKKIVNEDLAILI